MMENREQELIRQKEAEHEKYRRKQLNSASIKYLIFAIVVAIMSACTSLMLQDTLGVKHNYELMLIVYVGFIIWSQLEFRYVMKGV